MSINIEALNQRQAIVDRLHVTALREEGFALILDLAKALDQKLRATARVKASRLHLEEARALVFLNGVEGKNAEERAARLTLALRDAPDYQFALRDISEAEMALDEADAWLETTRMRLSANKAQLRIAAACLEMLAS